MSAEKDYLYCCLTKDGWVSIQDENVQVAGWVRLYEIEIYQGSPFGRTSRHWHLIKTNPATECDEAERLEKQFPRPEAQKELSPEFLRALRR
jgi:hypothetical protein